MIVLVFQGIRLGVLQDKHELPICVPHHGWIHYLISSTDLSGEVKYDFELKQYLFDRAFHLKNIPKEWQIVL